MSVIRRPCMSGIMCSKARPETTISKLLSKANKTRTEKLIIGRLIHMIETINTIKLTNGAKTDIKFPVSRMFCKAKYDRRNQPSQKYHTQIIEICEWTKSNEEQNYNDFHYFYSHALLEDHPAVIFLGASNTKNMNKSSSLAFLILAILSVSILVRESVAEAWIREKIWRGLKAHHKPRPLVAALPPLHRRRDYTKRGDDDGGLDADEDLYQLLDGRNE
uniref:Uncharacterized protein n=1 Tax=Romanomermis culicivorax TaxID=13658 RepID=A0A915JSE8_ROMCU